jgi:hypothetical protein
VRVAAEVLQVPLTKILEFADSGEHLVLRAGLGWAEGLVGRGEVGIDLESQAGFTLLAKKPVIVKDLRPRRASAARRCCTITACAAASRSPSPA